MLWLKRGVISYAREKVIQEGKAVLNEMNATLLEIEDLPLKKLSERE